MLIPVSSLLEGVTPTATSSPGNTSELKQSDSPDVNSPTFTLGMSLITSAENPDITK